MRTIWSKARFGRRAPPSADVEAHSGHGSGLVWSQSYERELKSVLGLQLEVSAAIAEQVRVGISREARASIARRHSRNAEAYDLYLRGRTLWIARNPARPSVRSNTTSVLSRWTRLCARLVRHRRRALGRSRERRRRARSNRDGSPARR